MARPPLLTTVLPVGLNSVTKMQPTEQVATVRLVKFRSDYDRLAVGPSAGGFEVTVGSISVWLDRDTAEELMCLIATALEPGDPLWNDSTGSN